MNINIKPSRLSAEARRAQILDEAKRCFARHGFAGTTTKSVAAAAGVSEGLLFRHFPTKAALYDAILSEACEADPELAHLQALAPSTATLAVLVREMVTHCLHGGYSADAQQGQRLRLMFSSHLHDGEFARMLFAKINEVFRPLFIASLEEAIASGDAVRVGKDPGNLFWLAHHTVMMLVLTTMPAKPTLAYGEPADLTRQVSEFILRGLGLTDAAIVTNLDRTPPCGAVLKESA